MRRVEADEEEKTTDLAEKKVLPAFIKLLLGVNVGLVLSDESGEGSGVFDVSQEDLRLPVPFLDGSMRSVGLGSKKKARVSLLFSEGPKMGERGCCLLLDEALRTIEQRKGDVSPLRRGERRGMSPSRTSKYSSPLQLGSLVPLSVDVLRCSKKSSIWFPILTRGTSRLLFPSARSRRSWEGTKDQTSQFKNFDGKEQTKDGSRTTHFLIPRTRRRERTKRGKAKVSQNETRPSPSPLPPFFLPPTLTSSIGGVGPPPPSPFPNKYSASPVTSRFLFPFAPFLTSPKSA